jgi:pyruvate dehydrogenase E1 component alpha subunit
VSFDKKLALKLLREMEYIRRVEEGIAERYPQGLMHCPTHLSIGQEAAAVGVGVLLGSADLAISTHRGHAHYLAKGGNLKSMLAEIYGKSAGCSKGRGGSMHLTDPSVGFIGSTAIVGNSIPIGVGIGLSIKLKKTNDLSVVYLGDGSTEEGAFYESVNFSIVRKLPVLFICENNLYSVYSPLSVRQPKGRKIYEMVAAMGLTSAHADGNDVEKCYQAAQEAINFVRSGMGPYFLELSTYRWREHCGPNYDNDIGYRTEAEFLDWKERDPIASYAKKLAQNNVLNSAEYLNMQNQINAEINEAFSYAEVMPFPDSSEAFEGLYAVDEGFYK